VLSERQGRLTVAAARGFAGFDDAHLLGLDIGSSGRLGEGVLGLLLLEN